MHEDDGCYVPVGIHKFQLLTFNLDNADFAKDTNVTTHGFLLVGFQNQDTKKEVEKLSLNLEHASKTTKLIPNNFDELLPCQKPSGKTFVLSNGCKEYVQERNN